MGLLLAVTLLFAPGSIFVFEDEYIVAPRVALEARANRSSEARHERAVVNRHPRHNPVRYDPARDRCLDPAFASSYRSCSPNYAVRAHVDPNDERFAQQWNLSSAGIGATDAWELTTGSPQPIVAVLDTGIDYRHPDLRGNLWVNPGELPGNGVDDDANGYVDDVHGIDAILDNGDPRDDSGHGTHVSGVIGAVTNNITGVAGINWNARIMALKFLQADGVGRLSDAVQAIDYLMMMKRRGVDVRVMNSSWGGSPYSQVFSDVLAELGAAGVAVVVSAGNEGNDNDLSPHYPASFDLPNLVSVASLTRLGRLSAFSNYRSKAVQLAAPGSEILSTFPGGGYVSYSGTSMAAPQVSGILSLLFSREPELLPQEAVRRLRDTALPIVPETAAESTVRRIYATSVLVPGVQPFLVNGVEVVPDRAGAFTERAVGGRHLSLRIYGRGSGTASIELGLDGMPCKRPISVSVVNGVGEFRLFLPRSMRRSIRRLDVSVQGLSYSIPIVKRAVKGVKLGRPAICALYLSG